MHFGRIVSTPDLEVGVLVAGEKSACTLVGFYLGEEGIAYLRPAAVNPLGARGQEENMLILLSSLMNWRSRNLRAISVKETIEVGTCLPCNIGERRSRQ